MDTKLTTLTGGKTITVTYEPIADASAEGGFQPSKTESIKVRQVPVKDFDAGVGHVRQKDEVALVGFLCGRSREWALTLSPASYEEILATGREVNERGFFSSCRRRMELEEKENSNWMVAMASLPPETLKLAIELGQKSTLPTSSPGYVPRPVR